MKRTMCAGLMVAVLFAVAGTLAEVTQTCTEEQLPQYLKSGTPEQCSSANGPGNAAEGFSFQTCDKNAPLQGTVSVTPDPIKIPGKVSVSFKGHAGVPVTSPTKVVVKVQQKWMLMWVTIPCTHNVGSCTYDDVCSMIPFKAGDPCPPPLSTYNLPCSCPFPKGPYNLPPFEITIGNIGLPGWLASGHFYVSVKLYNKQGDQLACFDASFSVSA